MNILIILFFTIGLSWSGYAPAKTLEGEKIFRSMKDLVYKVKTSLDLDTEKVSYGSGFPIAKNGLLITNYHVVARALDKDENYKIIVVVGDKNYEAKVLNFSVTHDLSLLKIEHEFPQIVSIAPEEPFKGERIFSMGYPQDLDLTLIEGVFNGDEINGNYKQYHVSAPINGGMSGGPAVNSKHELIGVNVSGLIGAQNVSFLVPKEFVVELITEPGSENYLNDPEQVDLRIKNNLLKSQAELLEDFLKKSKRVTFGSFTFFKGPESLKCWENDHSEKKRYLYKGLTNYCYVRSASYIKESTYSGSYALTYHYYSSEKLWFPAFYQLLTDAFSENINLEEVLIRFSENKYTTNYSCRSRKVKNKNGIPLKLSYCLNGYNQMSELMDIDFRAVTMLKKKLGLVIKGKLSGFTVGSIEKFLDHVVEGVEFNDNKN